MESFINALSSETAIAIYALIGAGLTASGLTEMIKRKVKLINKGVILFLLTTMSAVPVFVAQVMDYLSQNPTVLGSYTAMVLGVATIVYRLPIKPIANYLHEVNEYKDAKKATTASKIEAPLLAQDEIDLLVADEQVEQTTNKHAF